jgi:hypothetical protein
LKQPLVLGISMSSELIARNDAPAQLCYSPRMC